MRLSSAEPGIAFSSFAHTALLVAALVGFWSPKPFEELSEAVPVEVITEAQLRQITEGRKDAKKVVPKPAPTPAPSAEAPVAKPEPAEPRPVVASLPPPPPRPIDIVPPAPEPPKPAEAKPEPLKPEPPKPVEAKPLPAPAPRPVTRSAVAPEAKPEPAKPAEPKKLEPPKDAEVVKPAPAPSRKPEPKPVEKPKAAAKPAPKPTEDEDDDEETPAKPTPVKPAVKPPRKPVEKPDQIARLIEPGPATPTPPAPAKPAPAKSKPDAPPGAGFDRSDIEKVLRAGQPPANPGAATPGPAQRQASLGAPSGRAEKLTPSDRDALIGLISEQLRRCWSLPPGTSPANKPAVAFAVTVEGIVTGEPRVTNSRADPGFQATAASAVRAVQRCSRLKIPERFKPFHQDWARMVITFDPTEAF